MHTQNHRSSRSLLPAALAGAAVFVACPPQFTQPVTAPLQINQIEFEDDNGAGGAFNLFSSVFPAGPFTGMQTYSPIIVNNPSGAISQPIPVGFSTMRVMLNRLIQGNSLVDGSGTQVGLCSGYNNAVPPPTGNGTEASDLPFQTDSTYLASCNSNSDCGPALACAADYSVSPPVTRCIDSFNLFCNKDSDCGTGLSCRTDATIAMMPPTSCPPLPDSNNSGCTKRCMVPPPTSILLYRQGTNSACSTDLDCQASGAGTTVCVGATSTTQGTCALPVSICYDPSGFTAAPELATPGGQACSADSDCPSGQGCTQYKVCEPTLCAQTGSNIPPDDTFLTNDGHCSLPSPAIVVTPQVGLASCQGYPQSIVGPITELCTPVGGAAMEPALCCSGDNSGPGGTCTAGTGTFVLEIKGSRILDDSNSPMSGGDQKFTFTVAPTQFYTAVFSAGPENIDPARCEMDGLHTMGWAGCANLFNGAQNIPTNDITNEPTSVLVGFTVGLSAMTATMGSTGAIRYQINGREVLWSLPPPGYGGALGPINYPYGLGANYFGAFTYGDPRVIEIDPIAPLEPNQTHTIEVTTAMKDINGQALAGNGPGCNGDMTCAFKMSFTTTSTPEGGGTGFYVNRTIPTDGTINFPLTGTLTLIVSGPLKVDDATGTLPASALSGIKLVDSKNNPVALDIEVPDSQLEPPLGPPPNTPTFKGRARIITVCPVQMAGQTCIDYTTGMPSGNQQFLNWAETYTLTGTLTDESGDTLQIHDPLSKKNSSSLTFTTTDFQILGTNSSPANLSNIPAESAIGVGAALSGVADPATVSTSDVTFDQCDSSGCSTAIPITVSAVAGPPAGIIITPALPNCSTNMGGMTTGACTSSSDCAAGYYCQADTTVTGVTQSPQCAACVYEYSTQYQATFTNAIKTSGMSGLQQQPGRALSTSYTPAAGACAKNADCTAGGTCVNGSCNTGQLSFTTEGLTLISTAPVSSTSQPASDGVGINVNYRPGLTDQLFVNFTAPLDAASVEGSCGSAVCTPGQKATKGCAVDTNGTQGPCVQLRKNGVYVPAQVALVQNTTTGQPDIVSLTALPTVNSTMTCDDAANPCPVGTLCGNANHPELAAGKCSWEPNTNHTIVVFNTVQTRPAPGKSVATLGTTYNYSFTTACAP
jgi:hypothetical protein